jgi:hypothetical protein
VTRALASPVVTAVQWSVGADACGNLCPVKQRPEQKVDTTMALMRAVGHAIAEDTGEGDLMNFLRNPIFV